MLIFIRICGDIQADIHICVDIQANMHICVDIQANIHMCVDFYAYTGCFINSVFLKSSVTCRNHGQY